MEIFLNGLGIGFAAMGIGFGVFLILRGLKI